MWSLAGSWVLGRPTHNTRCVALMCATQRSIGRGACWGWWSIRVRSCFLWALGVLIYV